MCVQGASKKMEFLGSDSSSCSSSSDDSSIESDFESDALPLQCPLLWDIDPMGQQELEQLSDPDVAERAAGIPWDGVVIKMHVAHSEFVQGHVARCRDFITQCMMPLLPLPGFDTGCSVLRTYAVGMKHVLSCMWLSTFLHEKVHALGDDDSVWDDVLLDVMDFGVQVDSLEELEPPQQAAVHAIRAELESFDCLEVKLRYIDLAISLCPEEGHWHTVKGSLLQYARSNRQHVDAGTVGVPSKEEMSELKIGWKLRKTPSSCGLLAMAYMFKRTRKGYETGAKLARAATSLWPENKYVMQMAAAVFIMESPFKDITFSGACLQLSGAGDMLKSLWRGRKDQRSVKKIVEKKQSASLNPKSTGSKKPNAKSIGPDVLSIARKVNT